MASRSSVPSDQPRSKQLLFSVPAHRTNKMEYTAHSRWVCDVFAFAVDVDDDVDGDYCYSAAVVVLVVLLLFLVHVLVLLADCFVALPVPVAFVAGLLVPVAPSPAHMTDSHLSISP